MLRTIESASTVKKKYFYPLAKQHFSNQRFLNFFICHELETLDLIRHYKRTDLFNFSLLFSYPTIPYQRISIFNFQLFFQLDSLSLFIISLSYSIFLLSHFLYFHFSVLLFFYFSAFLHFLLYSMYEKQKETKENKSK